MAEVTHVRKEKHEEYAEFMASDEAAKELILYARHRMHKNWMAKPAAVAVVEAATAEKGEVGRVGQSSDAFWTCGSLYPGVTLWGATGAPHQVRSSEGHK